ncbi:MAG: alpha/beta hydrolase [Acidimicrobiia bacterium]
MSGLRPPPREDKPGGVVLRILGLVLLVLIAGTVIYSAVTQQRLELIEDTTVSELDINTIVDVGGVELNVVREGDGTVPLVLLHDFDVAGGALWDSVATQLAPDFDIIRVDLPGFGLSQRFPDEGAPHTVASMAEVVSNLLSQTVDQPVVVAGVGLGGEVAAELSVTSPDQVAALVMIDVDFYDKDGWAEFLEKLPWLGRAATFAFDSGGNLGASRWAPHCGDEGGWCPTAAQVAARDLAETIVGTTDSLRAFRRTPAASLVPSKLGEIGAPTYYLWSQSGNVPRQSVDKVQQAMPGAQFDVVADAWKAHLDAPETVAEAIRSIAP